MLRQYQHLKFVAYTLTIYRLVVLSLDEGILHFSSRSTILCALSTQNYSVGSPAVPQRTVPNLYTRKSVAV